MKTSSLTPTTAARIPTKDGEFWLHHYLDETDGKEHLALVMGTLGDGTDVLTRVHSECFTGDVIGSLRCDCGEQLQAAMQIIAAEGRGVILYLRQEGRGIGLAQKLRAYNLQDEGYDTVDANLLLGHQADERRYDAAAAMMSSLGISSIRLLTNNPDKIEHLRTLGISVKQRIPLEPRIHPDNAAYLTTKVQRMRHLLSLPNGHHANGHPTTLPLVMQQRLAALNARALDHYERTGRPFVNLSFAQSLDGSLTARRGEPLTLSSRDSMTLTHALRASHDGILVGIGTALADNPRLNVRLVTGANPQPIVVDSHLRLPPDARLFEQHKTVWIATSCPDPKRQVVLEARGARIIQVPADESGLVDLGALLMHLGDAGIRNLMVEGGARILSSFLTQRLAHYVTMTIAPLFVGGLRLLDSTCGPSLLPQPFPRLAHAEITQRGPDTIVWGAIE